MNLHEYLDEYKTLTLALINEVKINSNLDSLIEKREKILELIKDKDYSKEDIEVAVKSLKLLELEEELQHSVKKEMVEIKKEINNLKKIGQVNSNYNKIEDRARIFNKNI